MSQYTPEQVEAIAASVAAAWTKSDPLVREKRCKQAATILRAYAATLRQQVSDVETMLNECVPGGSIVDPQLVCDNIREWFLRNTLRQAPAQEAPLSSRLRPQVECAPWVIEEVRKLEAALSAQQQGQGDEQAAVDREVGRRWREDSSLEAWFPVTATTMKCQAEEIAATTKLLAPLFKNVDPMAGDCMIGINRTVTLYGYAADVVKQLKAATAPPAQPAERVPDPETACAMWIKPTTSEAESDAFLAGARAMLAASPAPSPARGDGGEG